MGFIHPLREGSAVNRRQQNSVTALAVILSMLLGCTLQAPYMRGWDPAEGISNRWTGGTFNEKKLSNDEAAVYKELGTPEAVRMFRTLETRQRVYEWVYLKAERNVWFVDGTRVDYVTVDADSSAFTKESRETLQDKLVTGGIVGGVVGGVAAGFLLLGPKLGLRD
jgi:hypothetical protein